MFFLVFQKSKISADDKPCSGSFSTSQTDEKFKERKKFNIFSYSQSQNSFKFEYCILDIQGDQN